MLWAFGDGLLAAVCCCETESFAAWQNVDARISGSGWQPIGRAAILADSASRAATRLLRFEDRALRYLFAYPRTLRTAATRSISYRSSRKAQQSPCPVSRAPSAASTSTNTHPTPTEQGDGHVIANHRTTAPSSAVTASSLVSSSLALSHQSCEPHNRNRRVDKAG